MLVINFGEKIFTKKIFSQKNFWSKKNFGQKNSCSKKNFSEDFFLVKQNSWSKKILVMIVFGHKKFSVKKIFWLKNIFWLKKIWGKENHVKRFFL